MRKLFLLPAIALLVWAADGAPAVAQAIGSVKNVIVYAYGTPEDGRRAALFARGRVFVQERVETVRSGGLNIEFVDGTVLQRGGAPESVPAAARSRWCLFR